MIANSLLQIYQPEMAGVEKAKKALWALLRSYDAQGCAKLTVTTEKGKLKVILEESFNEHSKVLPCAKAPKGSVQARFAARRRELPTLL